MVYYYFKVLNMFEIDKVYSSIFTFPMILPWMSLQILVIAISWWMCCSCKQWMNTYECSTSILMARNSNRNRSRMWIYKKQNSCLKIHEARNGNTSRLFTFHELLTRFRKYASMQCCSSYPHVFWKLKFISWLSGMIIKGIQKMFRGWNGHYITVVYSYSVSVWIHKYTSNTGEIQKFYAF